MADNTRRVQAFQVHRFLRFAHELGLQPLPAEESTLCLWVARLAESVKPNTIKAYLDSIRSVHVDLGIPWAGSSRRIARMLAGAARECSGGARVPPRIAITAEIVSRACLLLTSSFDHLLLKAVMWTATAGLFRIGEIAPLAADSDRLLLFSDISASLLPQSFSITLRHSKTDRFGPSHPISISSPSACRAMSSYLQARFSSTTAHTSSSPLFALSDGSPLLRPTLIASMKKLLNCLGIDASQYRAISFRAGGASSLAARGVDVLSIKRAGRWRSSAFERYIDEPVAPNPTGLL